MARTKNEQPADSVSVNVADFQRTRDSVIVALATLQSSVQDLSRAYINHANTVLSPGNTGQSQLSLGLTSTLLDTGLIGQQVHAPDPIEADSGETKKKRKRAPHDPNAPKRALTPYFLYMQSARSQIAAELGDNAKPKEVADEGTRRWADMAEEDKNVWNTLYARNLAIYREKMKAYKAGMPIPDDAEAAKLVDSGAAPLPTVDEPEVEDDDDDSPEPVKVPEAPKGGKRRKTGDKPATPAKEAPAPAPTKKSPEKKKSDKKAAPAPPAPKAAAPAVETNKKKKTAKK